MTVEEESRLLKRAAGGQTEAFRMLFEHHRDAVFRLAYRLTGAQQVAEDATQECFLALLRHPDRFDARRGTLRQYLSGAVRNLARQHYHASAREVPLDEEPLHFEIEELISRDLSAAVQDAIGTLPPLQREAIVLFEFEEMSLDEIAGASGCDAGTVKSRLHRARARLKRLLAPYWDRERVCHEPTE